MSRLPERSAQIRAAVAGLQCRVVLRKRQAAGPIVRFSDRGFGDTDSVGQSSNALGIGHNLPSRICWSFGSGQHGLGRSLPPLRSAAASIAPPSGLPSLQTWHPPTMGVCQTPAPGTTQQTLGIQPARFDDKELSETDPTHHRGGRAGDRLPARFICRHRAQSSDPSKPPGRRRFRQVAMRVKHTHHSGIHPRGPCRVSTIVLALPEYNPYCQLTPVYHARGFAAGGASVYTAQRRQDYCAAYE